MGLLTKIKQRGVIYSLGIIFNRLVPERLFRFRRFVVYQLDSEKTRTPLRQPTDASSVSNGVNVRWCGNEDDFSRLEESTYFRRQFTSGETQGVMAYVDGKITGGFWVNTSQFDESELGIRIILSRQQAWLFSAYIEQEFRRRGIYRQILQFIIPEMVAKGFPELLVAVNPANIGSNKVHKAYAKETVGNVTAIRVLGVAMCFVSGKISKSQTLTLSTKKRPIEINFPNLAIEFTNSLTQAREKNPLRIFGPVSPFRSRIPSSKLFRFSHLNP